MREARAYNDSTLFMVAVPYGLLLGFGLALYILYRKKLRLLAEEASRLQEIGPECQPLTAAARP